MIYKPDSNENINSAIFILLQQNNLKAADIDVVICGLNGDEKLDKPYYQIIENNFTDSTIAYYKHLSGEYHTANSFGFLLAAQILKSQSIPTAVVLKDKKRVPKTVLLYNHYRGINYSLMLFSAC